MVQFYVSQSKHLSKLFVYVGSTRSAHIQLVVEMNSESCSKSKNVPGALIRPARTSPPPGAEAAAGAEAAEAAEASAAATAAAGAAADLVGERIGGVRKRTNQL